MNNTTATEPSRVFHLRDGFHFERFNDGRIRIFVQPQIDGPILSEIVTDASGFASVMATMSVRNETGETWKEAVDYLQKL